jgi:hypothetical protein
MNMTFRILGILILGLGAFVTAWGAEGTDGASVTVEYYYKIVPGGMMPGGAVRVVITLLEKPPPHSATTEERRLDSE